VVAVVTAAASSVATEAAAAADKGVNFLLIAIFAGLLADPHTCLLVQMMTPAVFFIPWSPGPITKLTLHKESESFAFSPPLTL